MSYYQRECPNCAAMFGKMLTQCPHCGYIVEESASRLAFRPKEVSQVPETESGQSFLAYRLAAVVLFVNALLISVDVLLGIVEYGAPNVSRIVTMIIDVALGVGLLQFRSGARSWVLFRVVLGTVLFFVIAFISSDLMTAVISTVVQLSFCGSLVLLLTGESKAWRLIVAGGLYVVLVLAPNMLILLFSVLMVAP